MTRKHGTEPHISFHLNPAIVVSGIVNLDELVMCGSNISSACFGGCPT
jgi:hypothetical protein